MALLGAAFTIGIFCDGGIDAWFDYASSELFSSEVFLSWGGLALIIIGTVCYIMLPKSTLVITDQRTFGMTLFGHRVDIPLDAISSVEIGFLNSVIIASSSGKIHFIGVGNKDEIHKILIDLLRKRNTSSTISNISQ